MHRLRAGSLHHFIDESDISESASSHNLIIATSSSIGVEVSGFHTLGQEVFSSGGSLGDVACRGDVICCNGVTEVAKHVSIFNSLSGLNFLSHALEERRVVYVCGVFIPLIQLALRSVQSVPSVSALCDSLINLLEHFGLNHRLSDFLH